MTLTYDLIHGLGEVAFDDLLHGVRHVRRQLVHILVELRQPVVDLIQLDDDAGGAVVIAEPALLGAQAAESVDLELAELVTFRRLVVVAGGQLGAGVGVHETVPWTKAGKGGMRVLVLCQQSRERYFERSRTRRVLPRGSGE